MSSQETINKLLSQAQAGDRAAFDELTSEHRGRLETLIGLRLSPELQQRVEVEDVVQETLLRAYRAIHRVQVTEGRSLFAWLGTIAEHVLVDLARWHGRRPLRELDREVPARGGVSPSRGVRRDERFERLRAALDAMTPDHREVLVLTRIHGLSLKESAERMRRSPAAVSKLLGRALRKLRAEFGDTESLHLPPRTLEEPENERRIS